MKHYVLHDWKEMGPVKRDALRRLSRGLRVPIALMGVENYPRWRRVIERLRYRS